MEECRSLKGCREGEAKITKAYNIEQVKGEFFRHSFRHIRCHLILPACSAIIHVVGPCVSWDDEPDEEENGLLADCYSNALELAKTNSLKSIAFPCISTGVYNFPNGKAAEIALQTTKKVSGALQLRCALGLKI